MNRPKSRKCFTRFKTTGFRSVFLRAALPSLAMIAAFASPARADDLYLHGYYENDTHIRAADNTGKTVGLSKLRNTVQIEFKKGILDSGFAVNGIFRGTYDGVYDLNDKQYGDNAGGAVNLQTTTPGGFVDVPHGGGLNHDQVAGLGLTNNTFGFNSTNPNAPGYNPNSALRVIGDRWHSINGGAAFGVPVRPCDIDNRGCANFGGYGNKKGNELAFPEFNSRLDFIRELYIKGSIPVGDTSSVFVKLGRQQVVWGRTDLFRVLDVINPVDYSRNNIYDELQDIRIPQWILQTEYRLGGTRFLQDANFQLIWNFDKFRPNNLGQCGTPNVILDAGCLFRGLKNLWDNGGTVANFANVAPGVFLATDFGPRTIGLRNIDLPKWSLANTQIGGKFEGITPGGINFSLNALNYRSQLPSLHGGRGATNPFTGVASDPNPYLIAFDLVYPRVNLIGGSADIQLRSIKAALRFEGAYTHGEEFANTLHSELYSRNDVFRSVIGLDRPTFIPFINPNRTTVISAQLFYQHIFNHERQQGPLGPVGIADFKNNFIGTLLIKSVLVNDRVSPQVILANDFGARAVVVAPSVDWIINDQLKLTVGGNIKSLWGNIDRYKFDDCRSCNPFPPFTSGPNYPNDPFQPGSNGLGGIEPLGRFRAGPIGAAYKEDEGFVTLRYSF